MQSTTYIRDLKKAERLIGDECLLIQDVESTKQAPLSVVIDKVVEKSIVGVAEAIDEFNTTANQQITDNKQQIDTFVEDAQARVDEALEEADGINLKISETKRDILIQSKRIDSIIALPEGSTTSDAELVDLRIGADGYKYESAGECVRAQTSQKIALDKLIDPLSNSFLKEFEDYELEFRNGYYDKDLNFNNNEEYQHAIIDVTQGEEYLFKLNKVWINPGYFLFSNDRKIDFEKTEDAYGVIDCSIKIPSKCNKLIIQFSKLFYFQKLEKCYSKIESSSQIQDDLIDFSKVDKNLKNCFNLSYQDLKVDWISGAYMNNEGRLVNSDEFEYAKIEVKKNQKIKIHSKRRWESAAYVVKDKFGEVVCYDNADTGMESEVFDTISIQKDGFLFINNKEYLQELKINNKVSININDGSIDLNKLDSNLKDVYDFSFQKLEVDWIKGFILKSDGSLITSTNEHGYAVINVNPGMIFKITSSRAWMSSCYVIKDSNGQVILSDERDESVETRLVCEEIIIPENAKQLLIGMYGFKEIRVRNKLVMKHTSRLRDKLICYNGDSICQGVVNGGGYSKLIEEESGCFTENRAIGGGTLAAVEGATSHKICKDIVNMSGNADLVCFEGGINDYWSNVPLGELTNLSDFTGNLNEGTVIGALESIFRQALIKWSGIPVMFVIVHPVKDTRYRSNSAGYTFEELANSIKEVCRKYSIPCVDLLNESGGFNCDFPHISEKFTTNNDGCHPNIDGYERYYVNSIRSKMEQLI